MVSILSLDSPRSMEYDNQLSLIAFFISSLLRHVDERGRKRIFISNETNFASMDLILPTKERSTGNCVKSETLFEALPQDVLNKIKEVISFMFPGLSTSKAFLLDEIGTELAICCRAVCKITSRQSSERNATSQTLEGVDIMGERLSDETHFCYYLLKYLRDLNLGNFVTRKKIVISSYASPLDRTRNNMNTGSSLIKEEDNGYNHASTMANFFCDFDSSSV
ncbi:hypothetical protein R6Q59_003237 [Mikania micrantha]